ncbi:ras-related protein Rab-4B [Echinops telfairi]|uniref:Ras-related protein Rab-4 n=1 Tax=Echinops telfairi TaxID=9371 RepID=A0ABM0IY94_ECHTE|nr:ras-related protein Rab-4B [Echinops telfairi]
MGAPIRVFCPAHCPPSQPIPPFEKRGLVPRSPSGSRRRGWRRKWRRRARGVGRIRAAAGVRRLPAEEQARPQRHIEALSGRYRVMAETYGEGGEVGGCGAGTGKSCLLHQFIENKFKQDSNHTIGVEFGSRVVNVGGKTVKLQIWDTAGQERFRSVTRSYYRGAAGALLVYDITSRETYNSLAAWLTDARTLASPNIVVILCGNKKDLEPEREVTFLEASRFAQENELMFLETSALTGENVEEAFLKCARTILNKIDSGELDPERMGSGIQYGDASLRQLRQPRSAQAVAPQPCGC